MSKPPKSKPTQPFVNLPSIQVWSIAGEGDALIAFRALVDGKEKTVTTKGKSVLEAWLELEKWIYQQ